MVDRDKEFYLKKFNELLEFHDDDLVEILYIYTNELSGPEILYQMWQAGILEIDFKDLQLELNFED